MLSLNDIANKHGCDKGDRLYEAHDYAVLYDRLLRDLESKKGDLRLLEIGIFDPRFEGGSCRMWREFMPKIELFGFDINPRAKDLEKEIERLRVFTLNQYDYLAQRAAIDQVGSVDFVLDDGIHEMGAIMASLLVIWPNVSAGGLYVIEDLHAPGCQPRKTIENVAYAVLRDVQQIAWAKNEKVLVIEKKA